MMNRDDVQQLAQLARLSITDEQCDNYLKDFQNILSYIDALNAVNPDMVPQQQVLTNVVREDDEAYEAGSFSKEIISNAPHQEDGYIRVDKIL